MRFAEPAEYLAEFLALEYAASEPYSRFVYDTPDEAKAITRFLVENGAHEAAPPHGRVVVDNTSAVGAVVFLDGQALKQARMAAATGLVRGRKIDPRGPVRERLLLATETLLDVAIDDLYLSRIAVETSAWGRGVAQWMLDHYQDTARQRGHKRLVLEVSPMHPTAIRLYERFGFGVVDQRRASDPATGRELVYLHMIKTLSA